MGYKGEYFLHIELFEDILLLLDEMDSALREKNIVQASKSREKIYVIMAKIYHDNTIEVPF